LDLAAELSNYPYISNACSIAGFVDRERATLFNVTNYYESLGNSSGRLRKEGGCAMDNHFSVKQEE
jgi:hypothetical protein